MPIAGASVADETAWGQTRANSLFGSTVVEATASEAARWPDPWPAPHDDGGAGHRKFDLSPGHELAVVESEVNRWVDGRIGEP